MYENHTKNSADTRPIGIFDSGIGGLSIAQCIHETLPHESLVYVADSKFAPYGKLNTEQIIERVNYIADQLVKMNVKAIVIACNTATVNAIDQLRANLSIPIIGVEPAIKPAAQHSKTKSVGLLVTQATATNQRFLSLVEKHSNGANVHIQPCPDLAYVIEQGHANTLMSYTLLKRYLSPLLEKNIDKLVLGCTHYPFVSEQIKQILGDKVSLLETALPVTQELTRQLNKHNLSTSLEQSTLAKVNTSANIRFYSTKPSANQQHIIQQLWKTTEDNLNTPENTAQTNSNQMQLSLQNFV
ncbi:glutamate racemase [Thalassotalea atypica]|uniref:glutamate racemase n=1 Tax=Thalassotalea atypica TaxID=2054316 RepID=UPI00257268D0|nr:glutamate racemase [Thalassotalea atypica]